jgi:sigma-B regulation protein RsbU (phosphoserine phosphatase)
MTLFFGEIDLVDSSIRWARAGHDPGWLHDPGTGAFAELDGQGGLPLGVFEDAAYVEHYRKLAPGQIIAIGTDGIWEARNRAGAMFGKHTLQGIIREHAERPAAEIVQRVLEALDRFLSPLRIQDDATIVVIKMER